MNLGEYTKNTHWTKVDWLEGAGKDRGSPVVIKIFLLRVGWGRSWRSRQDLEVERVMLGSWAVVQFGRCGLGNCGAVVLRGSHSGRDGKLRTADSFIAQHTVFAQYS